MGLIYFYYIVEVRLLCGYLLDSCFLSNSSRSITDAKESLDGGAGAVSG